MEESFLVTKYFPPFLPDAGLIFHSSFSKSSVYPAFLSCFFNMHTWKYLCRLPLQTVLTLHLRACLFQVPLRRHRRNRRREPPALHPLPHPDQVLARIKRLALAINGLKPAINGLSIAINCPNLRGVGRDGVGAGRGPCGLRHSEPGPRPQAFYT